FTLQETSSTTFFDPSFLVYSANGTVLAASTAGATATADLIAPATEALMVVVRNATGFTGDYNYTLSVTGSHGVADTDGDGLADGAEISTGTNINAADSDFDGLSDGAEVNTYGTSPLLADTDGDGYSDGAEAAGGSNPLDPASVPANQADVPI